MLSSIVRRVGSCAPLFVALVAGCGGGDDVVLIEPRVGAIEESFREPARTRLARTFTIALPLDGRIARIDLEPGDEVTVGQELVSFDRVPLQERATEAKAMVAELEAAIALNEFNEIERTVLQEIKTAIEAAQETLNASRAQVDARKAHLERANKRLERKAKLKEESAVPQSELDDAQLAADTSLIDLRSEEFSLASNELMFTIIQLGPTYVEQWLQRKTMQRDELVQRLAQARARLAVAEYELSLARVVSPIDGVVLEKFEQGDAALRAGTPLLRLGNLTELEVIVDVLTEDALRLAVGSPVTLESASFPAPVTCRVKRIEPAGFTKLSSLGIEQQRVHVLVGFDDVPPGLGVGYRVRARFVTGRSEEAVIVPRPSVLQDPDGPYYVFEVADDRLVRRTVEVGLRSDLELEITTGIDSSATIVSAPDATFREGDEIESGG